MVREDWFWLESVLRFALNVCNFVRRLKRSDLSCCRKDIGINRNRMIKMVGRRGMENGVARVVGLLFAWTDRECADECWQDED